MDIKGQASSQERRGRASSKPQHLGAAAGAARRAALFEALPREITFTVDVEDPHGASGDPRRLAANTHRLLDLLEAAGGHGTFFVLDQAARQAPGLVREIAGRGHEVASHGVRHRALAEEQPDRFRAALAGAKARLEDLSGQPVLGFRAPMFSLTRRAMPWAVEALGGLGFAYSSSVVPAWNFLHGFPGAPRRPFVWPGGLLEIPCPVGRIGPLALPYLGGMYLRYLPPWRLRRFVRQPEAQSAGVIWTYCHPYDLDAGAGYGRMHDRGLAASLMLRLNRDGTAARLAALLEGRRSLPFARRLAAIRGGAVAFDPARPG